MKFTNIPDGRRGTYRIYESEDTEYSDPLEFYRSRYIIRRVDTWLETALAVSSESTYEEVKQTLIRLTIQKWNAKYEEYMNLNLPKNLLRLLDTTTKKKDQIKSLRGITLTIDVLTAFFLKAGELGYTYSEYRSQHFPNGLNTAALPNLCYIEDEQLNVVGDTSLSNGQLKQAVVNRKVKLSRFLDRGNEWHCFFWTYDSIGSKESWQDNQSHIHYISHKWGLTREKVLKELKSKTYSFPSLPHIAINK